MGEHFVNLERNMRSPALLVLAFSTLLLVSMRIVLANTNELTPEMMPFGFHDFESERKVSPKEKVMLRLLDRWCGECEQRIARAGGKKSKAIFDGKAVSCRLLIKADGQIANLEILKGSGSDITDKAALDQVRRAAPFRSSPDPSGVKNGLLIEFARSSVNVKVLPPAKTH